VDAGSISAAARALYISQPALSAALRSLEQDFGGPLLTRSSGGVALTQLGREVLPHARQLLHDAARLLDRSLEVPEQGLPERVRIGWTESYPLSVFAELFEQLTNRGVHPVLVPCMPWDAEGVLDGRMDLAVLGGPLAPDRRLGVQVLLHEPRGILVGRRHPLYDAAAGDITFADVAAAPALNVAGSGAPATWEHFWRFGPECNGETGPRVGHPVSSVTDTLMSACVTGGTAFVPRSLAAAARTWGLRYLEMPCRPSEMVICWRRNDRNPIVRLISRLMGPAQPPLLTSNRH
jgi:DNA-binding transcriptional LysR family regulator